MHRSTPPLDEKAAKPTPRLALFRAAIPATSLVLLVLFPVTPAAARRQAVIGTTLTDVDLTTIRPSALAHVIDEVAGRTVRMPQAKVVGVLSPRAFVVESPSPIPAAVGMRDRVIVLLDRGTTLRVEGDVLVGSNVVVIGVARTLLGMQVGAEVPWPPELTRGRVDHLDIRAAVLASAVQTAEGVDLTARVPGS